MPEIAEIARTVHYLRQQLLNKTLKKVSAAPDDIVFGKVGTSAGEIEKALTGRKVIDVGQQGKYFWMIMDKPPHPVMHFGMTGWFRFKGVPTYYYKGTEGTDGTEEWPPKYWKFHVVAEGKSKDMTEAAFIDARRLARVRLVDCDGNEIRKNTPLKENGPDPVIDKDVFTVDWLREKCQKKKVPIKAMLLDQANISGIGNWVGDEVLYNAKIHPEQYANTLKDDQVVQLHKSITYICETACELLADSDQFPKDWLFKHRWGKGKRKSPPTLANGEKIVFLTVGGRTSAVVPSVQKKTGPVAKDVDAEDQDDEDGDEEEKATSKKQSTKKRKAESEDDEEEAPSPQKVTKPKKSKAAGAERETKSTKTKIPKSGKSKKNGVKEEEPETSEIKPEISTAKPTKRGKKAEPESTKSEIGDAGRRRSGRTRN